MTAQHRYIYRPFSRTLGDFSAEALIKKIAREAHLSTPLFVYRDARGHEHLRVAYAIKTPAGHFEIYRAGEIDLKGNLTGSNSLKRLYRSSSEESVTRMFREHERNFARATHVGGEDNPLVSLRVHRAGQDVAGSPNTHAILNMLEYPGPHAIYTTGLKLREPPKRRPVQSLMGHTFH
jgi:hypothetical protein